MAKVSGIPTSITLDNAAGAAKVITNDVTSVSLSTTRGVQEITGLDKSAVERLLLLSDGKVTMKGIFNTAADMSHAVLSTSTSSSATRTLAIGYPGATMTLEVIIEDYSVDRPEGGELTWTASMSLCNGTVPAWT